MPPALKLVKLPTDVMLVCAAVCIVPYRFTALMLLNLLVVFAPILPTPSVPPLMIALVCDAVPMVIGEDTTKPAVYSVPAIPTPPSTISAPVVVELDDVEVLTVKPASVILARIFVNRVPPVWNEIFLPAVSVPKVKLPLFT